MSPGFSAAKRYHYKLVDALAKLYDTPGLANTSLSQRIQAETGLPKFEAAEALFGLLVGAIEGMDIYAHKGPAPLWCCCSACAGKAFYKHRYVHDPGSGRDLVARLTLADLGLNENSPLTVYTLLDDSSWYYLQATFDALMEEFIEAGASDFSAWLLEALRLPGERTPAALEI